jgi:hypothetical protein
MGLAPIDVVPGTLPEVSRKEVPVLLQDPGVLPGFRIHRIARGDGGRDKASQAKQ